MDEQQRRTQAISLYLQGKHPNTICKSLGRSRPWLYKWLKVYDPSNPHWARSQSRTPQRSPKKTAQAIVQLVCTIRKRLVKTKYAQKGAVAIQWQLEQLGVCPVPAIWTINRILKREGLLVKPIYRPRSTAYPNLQATAPNVAHQMDLVGLRYLKSKERFYGIHLIDIFSNAVALGAFASKRDIDIVQGVVDGWQRLGIPQFLQSTTSCRLEALTAIRIVSDCSSGSVCICKWRSSLFLQGNLGVMESWRSSTMSMTSCFSASSSLRTWPVYDQNCCASKRSTITLTVTPNSPNALPGPSIQQSPAAHYRSPFSFTASAFHGGRAKSPLFVSPITQAPFTSFLNGSRLQRTLSMNTSVGRSSPNKTCSSSSIRVRSLKSFATKLPNPKSVNDVLLLPCN